jgi:uncharacterized protein (DUF1499 family)
VSSDCDGKRHGIAPLELGGRDALEVWRAVKEAVGAMPRHRIVTETGDYLHVECRSALCGFADDLELQLRPEEGVIAVRSASRLGYSDFGVNRRRVEFLRRQPGVTL